MNEDATVRHRQHGLRTLGGLRSAVTVICLRVRCSLNMNGLVQFAKYWMRTDDAHFIRLILVHCPRSPGTFAGQNHSVRR